MWGHLLQNIITDGVGSTYWPLAVPCGNVADIDRTSVTASSQRFVTGDYRRTLCFSHNVCALT